MNIQIQLPSSSFREQTGGDSKPNRAPAEGAKKRRNRRGTRGVLLSLSLLAPLLLSGCGVSSKDLPDPSRSYEQFVRTGVKLVCSRMLRCYKKIYRTLPPDSIRRINQESCEESALENLSWKLSQHTPEMKRLSVECYISILDAPCPSFAAVAYWTPSCLQLRLRSAEAYAAAKGGPTVRKGDAVPAEEP